MTGEGEQVHPTDLQPQDLVTLEPHRIWDHQFGSKRDVEIVAPPVEMGEIAILMWREVPQGPGVGPGAAGATAYEVSQYVLRTGHAGGDAA